MAEINAYKSRVVPSGKLTTTANPYDFGVEASAALGEAANQMTNSANVASARSGQLSRTAMLASETSMVMHQMQTEDEITAVHSQVGDIHSRSQQFITELYNNTQPGDKQFVGKVGDYIDSQFKDLQSGVSSPAGQKLVASEAASLKREYLGQAIHLQSNLESQFAKNQATALIDNYSRVSSNDETQLGRAIEQVNKAIDDPEGRFARIPAALRDQFKYEAKEKLMTATAMGFVRRNPSAVMDSLTPETVNSLKTSRENPPAAGLPPNLNADTVKPYDVGAIAYRVRKLSAPTKYDTWFEEAARKEGIDPRELKLRSLVESNFDPNAKSSQGAGGIMQFTKETAAQYGIDREDPRDAIFGAAKVLADYQRKAGGDMSKVDRMYYGGESGKGWGANTHQYAANLAAVRQAAGLATTRTPESFAPSAAQSAGDMSGWRPVKTGFDFIDNLPVETQYSVLDKAHVMRNAQSADIERARVENERKVKLDQEANMSTIIKKIYDPRNNGGAVTAQDIASNDKLDPDQAIRLQNVLSHFNNEQSAANKDHPAAYVDFVKKIYAPEGDPAKIHNEDAIYNAMNNGDLSAKEFIDLREKLINHKNGANANINTYVRDALSSVEKAFYQNTALSAAEMANPGIIREAVANYHRFMETKILQYRKENKDPADLFLDNKNPDYFYNPKIMQRFIPAESISGAAAKVVQNETAASPDMRSLKPEEYNGFYEGLAPGALFIAPDGSTRRKQAAR